MQKAYKLQLRSKEQTSGINSHIPAPRQHVDMKPLFGEEIRLSSVCDACYSRLAHRNKELSLDIVFLSTSQPPGCRNTLHQVPKCVLCTESSIIKGICLKEHCHDPSYHSLCHSSCYNQGKQN